MEQIDGIAKEISSDVTTQVSAQHICTVFPVCQFDCSRLVRLEACSSRWNLQRWRQWKPRAQKYLLGSRSLWALQRSSPWLLPADWLWCLLNAWITTALPREKHSTCKLPRLPGLFHVLLLLQEYLACSCFIRTAREFARDLDMTTHLKVTVYVPWYSQHMPTRGTPVVAHTWLTPRGVIGG